MKKFTHIDEDLIKENLEIEEKFNVYYTDSLEMVDKIKIALDDFAIDQQKNPRDWGYIGSMSKVHEELTEIIEFLKPTEQEKLIIPNVPKEERATKPN